MEAHARSVQGRRGAGMTREEAVKKIQDDIYLHHDYLSGEYRKALKLAMTVLEQPERKKGKWEQVSVSYVSEMDEESREVIAIASMFCPQCNRYHNEVYIYGNPTYGVNFCPNCGADMREIIG